MSVLLHVNYQDTKHLEVESVHAVQVTGLASGPYLSYAKAWIGLLNQILPYMLLEP